MHNTPIQKQFSKRLSVAMLLAMILTVALLFALQTFTAQREAQKTESVQLAQAIEKMESNENAIISLKKSLDAEAVAKTNAFAFMIEQNPEILTDLPTLSRIRDFLEVDEIHVTDENGVLSYGSEPSMFGFDFATNDQTKPFLAGMTDKSFVMAQEPQPNATKGILFQYIGVARQDKPGVVQVGLRPERLETALKNNEIHNVLSGQSVGQGGFVFAVDAATGNFLAHKDAALIGTNAKEAGLTDSVVAAEETSGFVTMGAERYHYLVQSYDTMTLGAVIPVSEVYGSRNVMTLFFFISTLVIFCFLVAFISRLLHKNVTTGLHEICTDLALITGGDTNVVVNVRTNEEFNNLSDGINEMLESIKSKMEESLRVMESEEETFRQVKNISGTIQGISAGMLSVSDALTQGAHEQLEATDSLSCAFREVIGHISATSEKAHTAQNLSVTIGEQMKVGNAEMKDMVTSMGEISEHSNRIRNINKSIEDIAFQTNILALNAAVEAARAGVAGKGFSVVAEEVRNLAGKSAQSAKDTAALIEETLKSVQLGSDNARRIEKTLTDFLASAAQSTSLVGEISQMAAEQMRLVENVEQEMAHISAVVSSNTATAKESEISAAELSAQIHTLESLVGAGQ